VFICILDGALRYVLHLQELRCSCTLFPLQAHTPLLGYVAEPRVAWIPPILSVFSGFFDAGLLMFGVSARFFNLVFVCPRLFPIFPVPLCIYSLLSKWPPIPLHFLLHQAKHPLASSFFCTLRSISRCSFLACFVQLSEKSTTHHLVF